MEKSALDEIEVTDAMIEAGFNVLRYSYFSEGSLGDRDGLLMAEIYRAMVASRDAPE